jgi:hypothetical protein
MKQTATEYLFEKLWETPKDKLTWNAILEQAKLIERRQIVLSNYNGQSVFKRLKDVDINKMIDKSEQYYNNTYDK